MKIGPLFFLLLFLIGCSPAAPASTPELLNVYVTSGAYPQLDELYQCASPSLAVRLSDPAAADLTVRIGEPQNLSTPAFQISIEDILVVVHPQVGIGSLTIEQAHALFLGQVSNWKELGGNDLPVEVWTFAPDEDVEEIFTRAVMNGQPVTSGARLAVSAQAMSDEVGTQPGAVGLLPRRWKAGNTRQALVAASAPVLAITSSEPIGAVRELLGCLQSNP